MPATEADLWEPNPAAWEPGWRGGRLDVRPHGTHARYERHRIESRGARVTCEPCLQAELRYRLERRESYKGADPSWLERDSAARRKRRERAR